MARPPPHGSASAATSRRVLSRSARSPARGSGIATSRTQPVRRARARWPRESHWSSERPRGRPRASRSHERRDHERASLAAARDHSTGRIASGARSLAARIEDAGQRTNATPVCVHVVSTLFGAPRSRRTNRVRLFSVSACGNSSTAARTGSSRDPPRTSMLTGAGPASLLATRTSRNLPGHDARIALVAASHSSDANGEISTSSTESASPRSWLAARIPAASAADNEPREAKRSRSRRAPAGHRPAQLGTRRCRTRGAHRRSRSIVPPSPRPPCTRDRAPLRSTITTRPTARLAPVNTGRANASPASITTATRNANSNTSDSRSARAVARSGRSGMKRVVGSGVTRGFLLARMCSAITAALTAPAAHSAHGARKVTRPVPARTRRSPATQSGAPRDPSPRPRAPRSTPRPPRAIRARAPRATPRTPRDSPSRVSSTSERSSAGCSGSCAIIAARAGSSSSRATMCTASTSAPAVMRSRAARNSASSSARKSEMSTMRCVGRTRDSTGASDAFPAGETDSNSRAASPITPRRVRGGSCVDSLLARDHHADRIPRAVARPPRARSRFGTPAPTSLACARGKAIDADASSIEHRAQRRAIVRDAEEGAIGAREELPVEPARIVALAVRAILRELRRDAALRASDAFPRPAPRIVRRAGHVTPRSASSSEP